MREHERLLLTNRRVETLVQVGGILIDELVFNFAFGEVSEASFTRELVQHVWLYPDEVTRDIGWSGFEQRDVTIVVDGGNHSPIVFFFLGVSVGSSSAAWAGAAENSEERRRTADQIHIIRHMARKCSADFGNCFRFGNLIDSEITNVG